MVVAGRVTPADLRVHKLDGTGIAGSVSLVATENSVLEAWLALSGRQCGRVESIYHSPDRGARENVILAESRASRTNRAYFLVEPGRGDHEMTDKW